MPYLSPSALPGQPTTFSPLDDPERELRKKAVQKFLARAEISMVRLLCSLSTRRAACISPFDGCWSRSARLSSRSTDLCSGSCSYILHFPLLLTISSETLNPYSLLPSGNPCPPCATLLCFLQGDPQCPPPSPSRTRRSTPKPESSGLAQPHHRR